MAVLRDRFSDYADENEEKAKEWYDKAVEAGSTYAWYE